MKTITIPIPFRDMCWDVHALRHYTDNEVLLEQLGKVVTLVRFGNLEDAALLDDMLTVEDVRTALTDGADWPVEAAEAVAQFICVSSHEAVTSEDTDRLLTGLEKDLARISDAETIARQEANDRKALEDFADKLRAIKAPVMKTESGKTILRNALAQFEPEPVTTLEECTALSLTISTAAATLPDYI